MLDPLHTSSLLFGRKTNSPEKKKSSASVPVWVLNLVLTTASNLNDPKRFFFTKCGSNHPLEQSEGHQAIVFLSSTDNSSIQGLQTHLASTRLLVAQLK